MAPTPQEIQDREFREAFRGYNQDDVDTFLDEIAVEFGRLYQENQRMKVQLAALQQEVARLADARDRGPAPAAAPAVAATAPKEIDDAQIQTARKAAEAALEEAKRRAQETITRAEQRAREIDELTARRAKDVDADASAALTDAQKRVADLRRQEVELRRRIRTFLEQQLAAMETVDLDAGSRASASAVVDRMTREFAAEEGDPPPAPAGAVEPFWNAE
jgi:cell division initiation protein